MATTNLLPNGTVANTGWTASGGVAVHEALRADDAVIASGGSASVVTVELDNAPADFGSQNSVLLGLRAWVDAGAARTHALLVELLDPAGTVLETFSTGTLTTAEALYESAVLARADAAGAIDGYRLRFTDQEGSGMPGTEIVYVDVAYVALDYNAAAPPATIAAGFTTVGVTSFPAVLVEGAPPTPAGLYYSDFSEYTTGTRPQDMRRHRSPVGFHDWDQIVRDDGAYTGGKKLSYEASDLGSHVLSFDYIPTTEYQDVVARLTAGGTVDGGIGGVVVGSTSWWNDVANERRIGEFGARIYRENATWLMQLWRYDDAVLLAHDNATVSINAWFTPGTFARIRLRRDPSDTDGGANPLGTVRAKVWEDGTAEPAAWDLSFPITEGTPAGPCGIYGNVPGGLAQYDWVGVSTNPGEAAPEAEEGYATHVPATPAAPDLTDHEVEEFASGVIGQAPTGWSPYYQTSATFTEEAEADALDGRVLKAQRTGAEFRNFLRRDAAVPTDQEIVARVRYRTPGTGTFRGGVAVRLNSGDDAYGIHVTTGGQVGRFDYKNGTVTTATVIYHRSPVDNNDWFWLRLQAHGSFFRGKAWQDGELEPTFWAFELQDTERSSRLRWRSSWQQARGVRSGRRRVSPGTRTE